MIRAYKFLLRPTVRQAQALAEMLRDHCSLYNAALQERRDAWRHPSKTTVNSMGPRVRFQLGTTPLLNSLDLEDGERAS